MRAAVNRATSWILSLMGCAMLSSACGGVEARERIAVRAQTRGVDAPWLDEVFVSAIETSSNFAYAVDAPVTVDLMFEEPVPKVLRLELRILHGRLDGVDARVELERDLGAIDLSSDGPFLVRRGLRVLDETAELRLQGAVQAQRMLAGRDADTILLALEWVIEHPDLRWLPPTLALLDHEDERVAIAAVDAIAAIGDPEQAGAVANAARLAHREHTSHVYVALGRLGGPDAVAFLGFAARNEEDPYLGEIAEAMLAEARKPRPVEEPFLETPVRGHRGSLQSSKRAP